MYCLFQSDTGEVLVTATHAPMEGHVSQTLKIPQNFLVSVTLDLMDPRAKVKYETSVTVK